MPSLSESKLRTLLLAKTFYGRAVQSVEFEHIGAFSRESRLARVHVLLDGQPAKHLVLRANVWPLWAERIATAVSRRGAIRAPAPVFYDRASGIVLYEELAGKPLRALPLTDRTLRPLMAPLGSLLAEFQLIPAPREVPRISLAAANRLRSQHIRAITQADRAFGQRARAISIEASLLMKEHWKPKNLLLTHGDFQASNILLDKKLGLGLIDFTLSRKYLPVSDLGAFIVHFHAMARARLSERERRLLLRKFVAAYFKIIPIKSMSGIRSSLRLFVAEAALDVAATTLRSYGAKDKNGRALTSLILSPDFLSTTYV